MKQLYKTAMPLEYLIPSLVRISALPKEQIINKINETILKIFNDTYIRDILRCWTEKKMMETSSEDELFNKADEFLYLVFNKYVSTKRFNADLRKAFNDYQIKDIIRESVIDKDSILIFIIKHQHILRKVRGYIRRVVNDFYHQFTGDGKAVRYPKQLADNGDKEDDIITVSKEFDIDFPYRDFPFVIINGEYIPGKENNIHNDLIAKYLKDHNMDDLGLLENDRIRSSDDIPQFDSSIHIACGHAKDGIAFIETLINYNNFKSLAQLIKSKFKKVYQYSYKDNQVIRLAKVP